MAKKKKDAETRRKQVGEAKKQGLKRMFKIDEREEDEEQESARGEFKLIYEEAKSQEADGAAREREKKE